jgi:uncharacterized protein YjiS (DUF1127 family)
MRASSNRHSSPLLGTIVRWWLNWWGNRAAMAELNHLSADELRGIAQDIGVNREELRSLAGKWPDSADLLTHRMAVLQLDPAEIARSQPVVSNDLRKLCSLCGSKGQCSNDLISHAVHSNWQEYCPNTTTLRALNEQYVAHTASGKEG